MSVAWRYMTLSIIVICIASMAIAQVPSTVTYQGRLTESGTGQPLEGTVDLTFRLYACETCLDPDSMIWSETHLAVPLSGGLFEVALGSSSPLDAAAIASNGLLFLGIRVDGNPELTPRVPVRTVPFSFKSIYADSAGFASAVAGLAVGTDQIADLAVTSSKLNTHAATTDKIGPSAVTTDKLAEGSVSNSKLGDNAVTSDKIADGSIQVDDIGQNGAVADQVLKWNGSAWIPADDETGAAAGGDITAVTASGGLTGGGTSGDVDLSIAEGGVTGTKIASDAITTGKILDDAITSDKIAPGAVTSSEIADGTIGVNDIGQNSALPGQVLKWNGVSWEAAMDAAGPGGEIPDSSITGQKIAGHAVQYPHIAPFSISGEHVIPGSIDGLRIAPMGAAIGQVLKFDGTGWSPADDMNVDSVAGDITGVVATGGLIGGGDAGEVSLGINTYGVTNTRIGPNAVTTDKIDNGAVTASDLAANAVDSTKVISGGLSLSDIGQNGAASGQVIKWNGSAWAPATDGSGSGGYTIVAGDGINSMTSNDTLTLFIDDEEILGTMISFYSITRDHLVSNSVDSNKIVDGSISNNDLSSMGASEGQILIWDGQASKWYPDPLQVDGTEIVNNSVTSADIMNGTILAEDIARNGAADGEVLAWDSVSSTWAPSSAASGGVTSVTATGGLTASSSTGDITLSINNGGVTTEKIGYQAVTMNKIADGAVSTWNLTAGAVQSSNIYDHSIEGIDIAYGTITSSNLADSAVTAAKIKSRSIQPIHLSESIDFLSEGSITNAHISPTANISVDKIAGTAAALNVVNYFNSASYFLGNIGVGSAAITSHRLNVLSNAGGGTSSSTAHIENTAPDGIGLVVKATSTDLPLLISQHGTGNLLRCDSWIGGWHPVFTVKADGTTEVEVLKLTGGADVAEPFPISDNEEIPAGALVVIDEHNPGKLKLSTKSYDTRVAGVVSGAGGVNPGMILHQQGMLDDGREVALTGRVYALVDASYGSIKPGDLLTTSPTPGHAMKAADRTRAYGAVIGKAMTALDDGTGLVLVLVNLQ